MQRSDRPRRARRTIIVLAVITALESCVLAILAQGLVAALIGVAAGIVVWRGMSSIDALEGEQIVLRSTSEMAQVIEYGCAVALASLGIIGSVCAVRFAALPVPSYSGALLGVLGLWLVAPRVTRWVGIGAERSVK